MIALHKIAWPVFGVVSVTVLAAAPVLVIYPSGETVPENLLRIELRSSSPLRPAVGPGHLRLFTADGAEVENPFLDYALPGADEKRVAILFHPGRVKSGVGANLALGRALRAGEIVTLVVTHPALAGPVRKTWRVTAFDADCPDPSRWTLNLPRPGGRDPLVVTLDAPISAASEAMIAVGTPDGRGLAGSAVLRAGETSWCFTPDHPWRVGRYAVEVHPDLEDSAGNRPGVRFESSPASGVLPAPGATLSFEIAR